MWLERLGLLDVQLENSSFDYEREVEDSRAT